MVVREGVLESTPSRLGLLNAVVEVFELAGGDVAPCGGAGCRRRTHDLADLVERESPPRGARGSPQRVRPRPRRIGAAPTADRWAARCQAPRSSAGQNAPRPCAAPTLRSSAAHRRSSCLQRYLRALLGQRRRTFGEARLAARTNQEAGTSGQVVANADKITYWNGEPPTLA